MQTDERSSEGDLAAILSFLDANKSHLGDGDGVKDVISSFATSLNEELFGEREDEISFSPADLRAERFNEVLDSTGGEQVLGEIYSSQVSMPIFVFIGSKSLVTFIDLKFGGDGIHLPERDMQDVSMMDRSIAGLLFEHMAAALTTTMSTFAWRSTIFTENFVSSPITDLPHNGETYEHFKLHVDDDGIELAVVISFPSDLVELFRAEANPDHEEKKLQSNDPDWALHVENEILQSRIGLRALVTQQEFSIADISQIAVGQVLPINVKADDKLPILGDGNVLFFSNIGQLNGSYAMRVVDVLEPIDKLDYMR